MKVFLVSICLLFTLVTMAKAENINLRTPVAGAELSESTTASSVVVTLMLNVAEADDPEKVALDDFETLGCTAIDGTKKITGSLAVVSGEKLHPVCTIGVGATGNTLRSDWNKFNIEVGYKFKKDGVWTTSTYKGISPITRCVKVSDVSATIGTASRTGDKEISVPISLNADIRLNVELKKQNGTVVATPSGKANDTTVLFAKDDKARVVKLKLLEDILFQPSVVYVVSITQLNSQPSLMIEKTGDDSFSVKNFNAYTITSTEAKVLDDGSARVTFTTSTSGSIKAFLNGAEDPVFTQDNNTGNGSFTIPFGKVPAGANTLTFSGKATETDLPLTGKLSHSFDKDNVTFLKETPVIFTFDEASGDLKIRFSLSRNMRTKWQFKNANGFGANVIEVPGSTNLFEATINLNTLAQKNKEVVESKLAADTANNTPFQKAPVAIEIVNATNDKEIIASFELNFIKPKEAIIRKVKDANDLIVANNLKGAKRLIAELLGFNPTNLTEDQGDTIDGLIPQVRNETSTQGKVFKILGFAGKIAAGFFGIPLPFL